VGVADARDIKRGHFYFGLTRSSAHFALEWDFCYTYRLSTGVGQARSSVGERFLDTEEVGGSIPPVPIPMIRE
jgi:hypothetical protein